MTNLNHQMLLYDPDQSLSEAEMCEQAECIVYDDYSSCSSNCGKGQNNQPVLPLLPMQRSIVCQLWNFKTVTLDVVIPAPVPDLEMAP